MAIETLVQEPNTSRQTLHTPKVPFAVDNTGTEFIHPEVKSVDSDTFASVFYPSSITAYNKTIVARLKAALGILKPDTATAVIRRPAGLRPQDISKDMARAKEMPSNKALIPFFHGSLATRPGSYTSERASVASLVNGRLNALTNNEADPEAPISINPIAHGNSIVRAELSRGPLNGIDGLVIDPDFYPNSGGTPEGKKRAIANAVLHKIASATNPAGLLGSVGGDGYYQLSALEWIAGPAQCGAMAASFPEALTAFLDATLTARDETRRTGQGSNFLPALEIIGDKILAIDLKLRDQIIDTPTGKKVKPGKMVLRVFTREEYDKHLKENGFDEVEEIHCLDDRLKNKAIGKKEVDRKISNTVLFEMLNPNRSHILESKIRDEEYIPDHHMQVLAGLNINNPYDVAFARFLNNTQMLCNSCSDRPNVDMSLWAPSAEKEFGYDTPIIGGMLRFVDKIRGSRQTERLHTTSGLERLNPTSGAAIYLDSAEEIAANLDQLSILAVGLTIGGELDRGMLNQKGTHTHSTGRVTGFMLPLIDEPSNPNAILFNSEVIRTPQQQPGIAERPAGSILIVSSDVIIEKGTDKNDEGLKVESSQNQEIILERGRERLLSSLEVTRRKFEMVVEVNTKERELSILYVYTGKPLEGTFPFNLPTINQSFTRGIPWDVSNPFGSYDAEGNRYGQIIPQEDPAWRRLKEIELSHLELQIVDPRIQTEAIEEGKKPATPIQPDSSMYGYNHGPSASGWHRDTTGGIGPYLGR